MNTDVNALLGHWPFRKIRKQSLKDLMQAHKDNHIQCGYASSMNSIFYNDPFEGDLELHEWIRGTNYKHVLTVNPTLPGWEKDIEEGCRTFNIQGVRIYPGYHDYALCSDEVLQLCDILKRYELPLFVTVRLEDERLEYIVKSKPVDLNDVQQFVRMEQDLDIVLLNLRFHEVMRMEKEMIELPRLYFDTSGLKDRVFVLEELLKSSPADKILYGSEYPLYAMKSTIELVQMAQIDEEVKRKIFKENVKRLERRQ